MVKNDKTGKRDKKWSNVIKKMVKHCKTSLQAPSYASPKLSATESLTRVKCRATSVAENGHPWPKLSKMAKIFTNSQKLPKVV